MKYFVIIVRLTEKSVKFTQNFLNSFNILMIYIMYNSFKLKKHKFTQMKGRDLHCYI